MSRTPARQRESWSEKLYGVLLLAYSPAFRAESGPDMVEVFRDAHRTARQTRGRVGIAGGARPLPAPDPDGTHPLPHPLPTAPRPTHPPDGRTVGYLPSYRPPDLPSARLCDHFDRAAGVPRSPAEGGVAGIEKPYLLHQFDRNRFQAGYVPSPHIVHVHR